MNVEHLCCKRWPKLAWPSGLSRSCCVLLDESWHGYLFPSWHIAQEEQSPACITPTVKMRRTSDLGVLNQFLENFFRAANHTDQYPVRFSTQAAPTESDRYSSRSFPPITASKYAKVCIPSTAHAVRKGTPRRIPNSPNSRHRHVKNPANTRKEQTGGQWQPPPGFGSLSLAVMVVSGSDRRRGVLEDSLPC